eukprot:g29997.t1
MKKVVAFFVKLRVLLRRCSIATASFNDPKKSIGEGVTQLLDGVVSLDPAPCVKARSMDLIALEASWMRRRTATVENVLWECCLKLPEELCKKIFNFMKRTWVSALSDLRKETDVADDPPDDRTAAERRERFAKVGDSGEAASLVRSEASEHHFV